MMCHEDLYRDVLVPMDSEGSVHQIDLYASSSGVHRTDSEEASLQHKSSNKVITKKFLCTPEKQCTAAVYNPFDTEIESLSLPSFSPSVFTAAADEDENADKPFSWSIDQMAVLAPADIDESSHQAACQVVDYELEQRAQKTIENYFLHNVIVPSPWGVPTKQVTFSPNVVSETCFTKPKAVASFERKQQGTEVWTQTVLSIPPDVDILERLGDFCTFHCDQYAQKAYEEDDDSSDAKDSLSSSVLRRQLFTNDRNSCTPRSNRCAPTPDAKMLSSPLLPWKTPEKNATSFFTHSTAHFSSSPISANCSISSNVHLHSLSSPPLSPISMPIAVTPSTGNAKIEWNVRNKTPTCTSSPIARPSPDFRVYSNGVRFVETPSHQLRPTNTKAAVRLSLLMLSTSDEDCTQEMQSYVGSDVCAFLPKPSSSDQDTGYQTKSSNDLLPIGTESTSSCKSHSETIKSCAYTAGASESRIEVSSMDVDSFHQQCLDPFTDYSAGAVNSDGMPILSSGWKPPVCSMPHLGL